MQLMGTLTWQDGVEDTQHHGPRVEELQTDAVELWDAQPHKHVIGVKEAAENLPGGREGSQNKSHVTPVLYLKQGEVYTWRNLVAT